MSLTMELLDYLKRRYEEATGKKMISDGNMNSSQAPYYFQTLDDNLIEPMSPCTLQSYKEGDGKELEEKMRALRSSSAMTYNLIGNDQVTIKNSSGVFMPGTYQVTFEYQLPTIKNNPRKANLDVFLKGENALIFCEMKMTEWLFNRPGLLRENYFDRELYYDRESFDAFSSCLDKITMKEPTDYRIYPCAMAQYDAFQMYKHTLAVYNYCIQNKDRIPAVIRLVNCVWHLPKSAVLSERAREVYEEKERCEHREFELFYDSACDIRKCFKEKGFDFDILFLPADVFVNQLEKTEEQKSYLRRYFDWGIDSMLYKKEIRTKEEITYKPVLFKDKTDINQRTMDTYLSNIWELAAAVRSNNNALFFDSSFMNGESEHKPSHLECDYTADDNERETEKRICRCMKYFNEISLKCKGCHLPRKWKNTGKYKVIDYEVPTDYVVKTVGGIDLLVEGPDEKQYAVELKPPKSNETLVRMMAEIMTASWHTGGRYEPAICFFEGSRQHKDFLNPVLQKDTAFQFLLSKITVFYITYAEKENEPGVVEYVIHNHREEPYVKEGNHGILYKMD